MYDGAGIYEHYKGGHYRVYGKCRVEFNGATMVRYSSLSLDHELERAESGIEAILRPLTLADAHMCGIKDAFNEAVVVNGQPRPRFRKLAGDG